MLSSIPLLWRFRLHITIVSFSFGILSNTSHLGAQVWQDYPQPIGDLVRVWNVGGPIPFPIQPPPPAHYFPPPTIPLEEVNYICAQWDNNMTTATVPFDLNFPTTEITTTTPQHFVRVYAPGNAPNTGSGPNGAWFMRSSELRGLTPEQIQDRFALQAPPTMIINVDFPASPSPTGQDYAIWTGIAGPIAGWGNGGAFQNRIIADFNNTHYFPNYAFTLGTRDHPQPIGKFALAYSPMAGKGNSGRIAAYLDKFVPIANSDMEYVYTSLDYLNWINFGPKPLRKALNQISPEVYGTLPFVAKRNAQLVSGNFLDFRYPRNCCNLIDADSNCCEIHCIEPQLEIQWVAEQGQYQKHGKHLNFNYDTIGGIGNINLRFSKELMVGINAAYLDNKIHFHHDISHEHHQSVIGGFYASYDSLYYFFDGLLNGGYNWSHTRRSIEFLGVDREAKARPSGFDMDAHLQFGLNLPICTWWVTPLLRASYFYEGQNSFHEHGADSLNLNVHYFSNETFRTFLGIGLTRFFDFQSFRFIPQIQLAWAHDFCGNVRKIRANLNQLGGAFAVDYFRDNDDSFQVAAQLTVDMCDNISLVGRYDAGIEEYVISQSVQLSLDWSF